MICSKCRESREIGISVDLVSGTSNTKTNYDYSTATKRYKSWTTTYSDFKDLSLWICQDCWQLLIKRKLDEARKKVIKGAIPFGVVMLLYISVAISIRSGDNPLAIYGWNCIAGIPLIILGILEVIRIFTWNGLKKNTEMGMLECVTEKSVLDDLSDIIFPLVYESRKAEALEKKFGDILFWEAKAFYVWQKISQNKEKQKPNTYDIEIENGVPHILGQGKGSSKIFQ